MKSIRAKDENCHLSWKINEFGEDEFYGFFCGDCEPKWPKIRTDLEKELKVKNM